MCCLVPPSLRWCCVAPLFFAWCCVPFPPVGWDCVPPLFGWVVLLGLLLFWAVLLFQSPFVCCCLLSPPFGRTTFPPSSVGWCCLVHPSGVALFFVVLPFPPGWGCFFFPSGFPSLGGVAVFSVLLVGLLFTCLLLGGAAWSTPPWGGVASCFVSSFGRCCFSNLLSGGPAFLSLLWHGAAFLPLLWVVLLSFPSFVLGLRGFLLLWAVLLFPFFYVVLLSFPSFG